MAFWNEPSSQPVDDKDHYSDVMHALQIANAASHMDPAALLGYGIGSYAKDYIQRGIVRAQRNNSQDKSSDPTNIQSTNNNPNTTTYMTPTSQSMLLGAGLNPYSSGQAGTSAGQSAMDAATQAGANAESPSLFGGNLGDAASTAQDMAQSASQQPTVDNGIADKQAAMQQQATQVNQQFLANEDAKKKKILQLGIMAATGGFGGGGSSAGVTSVAGNKSLQSLIPGPLGNVSGSFFDGAASGPSSQAAGDDVVQQALQSAGYTDPNTGSVPDSLRINPQIAQQPQQMQQAQQPQQARTLDYVARQIASQLIEAKQEYAKAELEGNDAGKMQAAMKAQSIRDSANSAGINIDGYGMKNSLAEASQNYLNDTYRGLNNILNHDMTSDEYYQQVFNRVKENGGTDTVATKIARERAGVYQAQRVSRLGSAFENYGVNPNGSVNNIGVQILAAMGQENPTSANFYSNNYGTPKDEYAYGNAIGLQNNQAKNQYTNSYNLNNQKFDLNEKSADNELGRKKDFDQFHTNLSVQAQTRLAQVRAATENMASQAKINTRYSAAKAMGLSDDDAKTYALTGKLGGGGSNGKPPKWSEPVSAAYQKAINAVSSGDGGEEIDKFVETTAKYKPELDSDDADMLNSMALALNFMREKKAGNEDMAAQYYEEIPEYLRDKLLPGY